ncbi:FMN-binding protein [Serpentinicella sp. ANB-PHB4]|uniref:FMN-binding protein n=1 Tax=Serpentinicella sp. ANB-PHB4 TaxID=3074076 RepID=UPI002855B3A1|nr:FMN-binding protein [Serpentinicella sp. ANB-PHB4]MDR5658400.1 FMN-binding protein [Serpentinicella sp. ANB-PHB4]
MKKAIKIIAGIFLGIILVGAGGLFFMTRGLEEGKMVTIGEVDITGLEDGIYIGEYNSRRWTNKVEVKVQSNEIVEINLTDGFTHKDVMEKVYHRIIKDQSLDIDVVSGATVSSKAYIKAIENALGVE